MSCACLAWSCPCRPGSVRTKPTPEDNREKPWDGRAQASPPCATLVFLAWAQEGRCLPKQASMGAFLGTTAERRLSHTILTIRTSKGKRLWGRGRLLTPSSLFTKTVSPLSYLISFPYAWRPCKKVTELCFFCLRLVSQTFLLHIYFSFPLKELPLISFSQRQAHWLYIQNVLVTSLPDFPTPAVFPWLENTQLRILNFNLSDNQISGMYMWNYPM